MLNFARRLSYKTPLMLRLKTQIKPFPGNGNLCFLSSSANTQTILDSKNHLNHLSDTYISLTFSPTKFFISTLLTCKNAFQVKQVHTQLTTSGLLNHNLTLTNKLLYLYVRHKSSVNARKLFGKMSQRDAVSWSVMVGGFVRVGEYNNCFETFRGFIKCGGRIDNYMLPVVLRACKDVKGLVMGRLIHCIGLKSGLLLDHFVCGSLVDMYAKCGVVEDAKLLFCAMPSKDLVTWTTMIGGYADSGNAYESLVLFDQLREDGVLLDKIATVTVVNACAKLGALSKARLVSDYIYENKLSLDVILGTAMIDMYAKCGSVTSAREIFDQMKKKNVVSWSAMIAAYGYHGRGREALNLFPLMLDTGVRPNNVTFVSLLHACSHAGLVEGGLQLFSLMQEKYGIKPDVKHFTCVVDLLGRAGRVDEAMKFISEMKVEKDEGVWSALLGACRIHKYVDLAEKAAKSLIELQPQNPGHYILLSNIYANAGKWNEVAKMRDLLTKVGLKKIPGYTWIEVDNVLHRFGVGDKSHSSTKEIYEMLYSLRPKLELAGYVPDTTFVLHNVDEEVKVEMLYTHSEKLALAFGLIATPEGTCIRMSKNLRFCGDCHTFCKVVSAVTQREIIVRDANRFHHFNEGACSCGDYW